MALTFREFLIVSESLNDDGTLNEDLLLETLRRQLPEATLDDLKAKRDRFVQELASDPKSEERIRQMLMKKEITYADAAAARARRRDLARQGGKPEANPSMDDEAKQRTTHDDRAANARARARDRGYSPPERISAAQARTAQFASKNPPKGDVL